ncbi:serine hydrolase domain-containing protein, partial [Escherichia coli]
MSKSLTGLLAAQLIQEGRIDASAPVSRYLPELKDSAWDDATVQQTLDMTTGVQYDEDFSNPRSGIFQYLIAGGLVP